MKCLKCGKDDCLVTIFSEELVCDKCNNVITLSYVYCKTCGVMYEAHNGKLSYFLDTSNADTSVFAMFDDFSDLLDSLSDNIMRKESGDDKDNMGDYVHRCLKCNSISYEINPGTYECTNPECGFSWEVS